VGSNPTPATSNMKESDCRKKQNNRRSVYTELEGLKEEAKKPFKGKIGQPENVPLDIAKDAPPLPPLLAD
jgi:hypothetical protein